MIPNFPHFGQLSLEDKSEIEQITWQFPTYSDYNFVSLYSWDTQQKTEVSKFDDNLIVKFLDYITNESFFSFIGTGDPENTIKNLTLYAREKSANTKFRLVPQEVIKQITRRELFDIQADRDNFDIFSPSASFITRKKIWRQEKFYQ